jgi:hypothetical protein
MQLQEKLESKVEEHNQVVGQIEELAALRARLVGQIQLLQEMIETEKSPTGSGRSQKPKTRK